jgi:hypothetical protein
LFIGKFPSAPNLLGSIGDLGRSTGGTFGSFTEGFLLPSGTFSFSIGGTFASPPPCFGNFGSDGGLGFSMLNGFDSSGDDIFAPSGNPPPVADLFSGEVSGLRIGNCLGSVLGLLGVTAGTSGRFGFSTAGGGGATLGLLIAGLTNDGGTSRFTARGVVILFSGS